MLKCVRRVTRETSVSVALGFVPDVTKVSTADPFLDHMLGTLLRYAGLSGRIEATGDLRHHLLEDVAIVCGSVVAQLCPRGATRFAERTVPMDDALVQVVLDLGGRGFYRGPLPSRLYDHWMRTFADNARCTLHVRVLRGRDRHHIIEAGFKALGFALRDALRCEDSSVVSLKGEPFVEEITC